MNVALRLLMAGGEAPKPTFLTSSFLQSAISPSLLSTHTFTAQNLGAADTWRDIVVAVESHGTGGNKTATAVSVDGIAATFVVARSLTDSTASLWRVAVPSGTTGDVVVTFSAATINATVSLWRVIGGITGHTGNAASQNSGSSVSTTVTGVASGVIIAASYRTEVASTCTWTNATEDFDNAIASPKLSISGARSTTVGSTTITAAWTGSTSFIRAIVVGAFAP